MNIQDTSYKKNPTSEDVARLANVSRTTVSAYFNNAGKLSEKSRVKIRDAVEKLNYIPNEVARSLKMRNNNVIGLLVPVMSKFYLPMIRSVNDMIYQKGYTLLIGSTEEDPGRECELIRTFVANKVSGILTVPCSSKNTASYINAQSLGIPCVQLNRRIEGLRSDYVISDIRQAIIEAVEYLHTRRGCSRIALVGYTPDVLGNTEKLDGYALAANRFSLDKYIFVNEQSSYASTTGADISRYLSDNSIDGVVCTTRTYMEFIYQYLKDNRSKGARELSMVGYDDPFWATLVQPSITVISEDRQQMGHSAVELLFKRLESDSAAEPTEIVLKTEFIVRET